MQKTFAVLFLLSGSVLTLALLIDRIQKKEALKLKQKKALEQHHNVVNRYEKDQQLQLVYQQAREANADPATTPKSKMRPLENPGNGDCLFWCFQQALETLGKNTSVNDLRRVVADSVDSTAFEFVHSIFKSAVEDRNYEVQREFGFMRNVNSLDEMKEAMMTRVFWGDESALIALEEYTDLQAFVMKEGKMHKRPGVTPRKRGILLDLRSEHYRLFVNENGKAVFKTSLMVVK